MKHIFLLMLLAIFCCGAAASGPGSEDPDQGEQDQFMVSSSDPIDLWPGFSLALGFFYAPAPTLVYEDWDFTYTRNLRDQLGPLVSFDFRVADYLLLGGRFDTLVNENVWALEPAFRIGYLLPFDNRYAMHFMGTLGFSTLRAWPAGRTMTGLQTGLVLGLRARISKYVGLNFEISGSSAFYGEPGYYQLFRLQFVGGVMFGW